VEKWKIFLPGPLRPGDSALPAQGRCAGRNDPGAVIDLQNEPDRRCWLDSPGSRTLCSIVSLFLRRAAIRNQE